MSAGYVLVIAERRTDCTLKSARMPAGNGADAEWIARQASADYPPDGWRLDLWYRPADGFAVRLERDGSVR